MRSASLCAYSAEKLFYISRLSRSADRSKRIFTRGVWNELPQSKPIGFDSSLWEGAFGIAAKFPAKEQSGLPGSDPFRHRLRRCHLPQGDGF